MLEAILHRDLISATSGFKSSILPQSKRQKPTAVDTPLQTSRTVRDHYSQSGGCN
jgi:hypothetical protein